MSTIPNLAAIAALRLLVAQAPAETLGRPEYQDALALLARADGVPQADSGHAAGLDPILQSLIRTAMQVNQHHLAVVDVEVAWGSGYHPPCHTVSVSAYTSECTTGDISSYRWFFEASLRLSHEADRGRLREVLGLLSRVLTAGVPVTTANLTSEVLA